MLGPKYFTHTGASPVRPHDILTTFTKLAYPENVISRAHHESMRRCYVPQNLNVTVTLDKVLSIPYKKHLFLYRSKFAKLKVFV